MENDISKMSDFDLLHELYRLIDDKNLRIDPLLHARFSYLELEAERRGLL